MTTIKTNDGRNWKVIETKVVGPVTFHLVHANVLDEALAYADWGMIGEKNGATRFATAKNELDARTQFAAR